MRASGAAPARGSAILSSLTMQMPLLLVEPDPDAREAIRLVLEGDGHPVVTAANGLEALDHLRAGLKPCVIFLAVAMPLMDAAAFRRAQLAYVRWAAIPVVLLSAAADLAAVANELDVQGW